MYVTNLSVKLLWLCLPPPRHRLALEWGVCPNDNEAEIQIQMSLKDDNSSWREFGKFGTWDFSRYGIRRSSLTPDRSKMISINTTCIESPRRLMMMEKITGKQVGKGGFASIQSSVSFFFWLMMEDWAALESPYNKPAYSFVSEHMVYAWCIVYSVYCMYCTKHIHWPTWKYLHETVNGKTMWLLFYCSHCCPGVDRNYCFKMPPIKKV